MSKVISSIGVYGGSFDPVHFGHLRSTLEVRYQLELEQLRFIPAGNPPHKDGPRVSAADRVNMLELATDGNPDVVIDQRETRRQKPSYTIDTLQELQRELPHSGFTLIIGTDQFNVFDTWHRWQDLLAVARIAVMERPGEVHSEFANQLLQGEHASKITLCPVTQLDISSTRIRNYRRAGTDIRFLIPYAVHQYIIEHELYTGFTH